MQYLAEGVKKKIAGRILRAPHTFFFLDYDGTLAPIMPLPPMAHLRQSTRKVLERLSRKPSFSVGIISGRKSDEIQSLVSIKNIIYAGNHGLELKGPGFSYTHAKAAQFRWILRQIMAELEPLGGMFPGSFLEDKEVTLSFHFRLVNPAQMVALREEFRKRIFPWLEGEKVSITDAKMAFEIRPWFNWDKGSAVRWILLREGPESLPVYLGDDAADEEAFKALEDRGITIKVGDEKGSYAQYFVKDTYEVEKFLALLSALKVKGRG